MRCTCWKLSPATLFQPFGKTLGAESPPRGARARFLKACHGSETTASETTASETTVTLANHRARDARRRHRLLSRAGSAEPAAVARAAERPDVGRARGWLLLSTWRPLGPDPCPCHGRAQSQGRSLTRHAAATACCAVCLRARSGHVLRHGRKLDRVGTRRPRQPAIFLER